MPRREIGRALTTVLPMVVTVTLFVLACAPRERHAFLEFFIDGYPPYMTPAERERVELEQDKLEAEAEAEKKRLASRRHSPVRKLARFTHGPFAAKECGRCHDLGAASGFRGARGGGAMNDAALEDLAEGGRLRFPVMDLCIRCHTDFEAASLGSGGAFVHGPVGAGWCVMCHEAHSSYEPRLVRTAPTARLCGQCHLREDLVAFTPEHRPDDPEEGFPPPPRVDEKADEGKDQGDANPQPLDFVQVVKDCTRCHDPHSGPERTMLRERHEEAPAPEWDAGEAVKSARTVP